MDILSHIPLKLVVYGNSYAYGTKGTSCDKSRNLFEILGKSDGNVEVVFPTVGNSRATHHNQYSKRPFENLSLSECLLVMTVKWLNLSRWHNISIPANCVEVTFSLSKLYRNAPQPSIKRALGSVDYLGESHHIIQFENKCVGGSECCVKVTQTYRGVEVKGTAPVKTSFKQAFEYRHYEILLSHVAGVEDGVLGFEKQISEENWSLIQNFILCVTHLKTQFLRAPRRIVKFVIHSQLL